jgi:poly-beta-hydroxybutyrate-responsive repressor
MRNHAHDDQRLDARRGYGRGCVLLLLAEGPKHGYELLLQMAERGYGKADRGGLYRALQRMEGERLVSSSWESSDQGPARRVYTLTDHGHSTLRDSVTALHDMDTRLRCLLRHYRAAMARAAAARAGAQRVVQASLEDNRRIS